MNAHDLKLGMLCQSKKGVGIVSWIDAQDRAVYLQDVHNQHHHFAISFDDLQDEPQIHQTSDLYY
jgi:hypothetical protein